MKCKDCKFFSQSKYDLQDRPSRGSCLHPKVFGELGEDDDGFYEWEAAEIHVGKDFGCIHFEEKQ